MGALQGRFGYRGVVDAIARMAGVHRASVRSPQHGEWVSTAQTARSKGSAGVMVAAALRHGLATPHGGVGDRGIDLCRGRVLAFHHSGIVPGRALILSVYMHTGAGLTQQN